MADRILIVDDEASLRDALTRILTAERYEVRQAGDGREALGILGEGDQGQGFDPSTVADPLAPENLLRAYGRGIFFMRQFMDEVTHSFPVKGGTLVRMVKRAS